MIMIVFTWFFQTKCIGAFLKVEEVLVVLTRSLREELRPKQRKVIFAHLRKYCISFLSRDASSITLS